MPLRGEGSCGGGAPAEVEENDFFPPQPENLVRIQGKDLLTPVSRILIGNPGCTYKYLNTRLFTVPWPVKGSDAKYNEAEIAAACQTFLKLNSYLQVETIQALEELAAKEKANIDAVPVCIGPDFPRVGMGSSFDGHDEIDMKNRAVLLRGDRPQYGFQLPFCIVSCSSPPSPVGNALHRESLTLYSMHLPL